MKKWLGIFFVFLIIVMIATPWGIGIWIKDKYKKLLYDQDGFTIHLIDYQQHWLTSEAKLDLVVDIDQIQPLLNLFFIDVNKIPDRIHVIFKQEIKHNPFVQHLPIKWQEISWRAPDQSHWVLSDVVFQNEYVLSDELSDSFVLHIRQIKVNQASWGPVTIKMQMKHLNFQGIINTISAYEKIIREGELYQSQLRRKLSMLIPRMFNPNASIEFSEFNVVTPLGFFDLKGALDWPEKNYFIASDFIELLSASNINFKLKISRPLTDKMIELVATSPYFNGPLPSDRQLIMLVEKDLTWYLRQNALFILALVNDRLLSEDNAKQLLELQKNKLEPEDYINLLKQFYLTKNITLTTSYMLYLQFLPIQQQIDLIKIEWPDRQRNFYRALNEQLATWLQDKMVIEERGILSTEITMDGEGVKLNGKNI